MATWKKVLTEDDGNLATKNLSTASARTFQLTSSNSLTFLSQHGTALLKFISGPVSANTDSLEVVANFSVSHPLGSVAGGLVLKEATDNGGNSISLKAPASLGANYTLTLPTTDGNANQVLETDGSGNLSWVNQSSGGGVTINSNTNNYLLTASGTANTINGESQLTFDGVTLKTGRHLEYQPDIGARAGELYDGTDSGVYAAAGSVTGGDITYIPKSNTGVSFGRVYTISSSGQAELVSAANGSTNIGKIALLSPATATSGVSTQQMYLRGMATVRTSVIQGTFAYGAPIYLNPTTSGALTFAQPSTSNQYVRRMGYAINSVAISGINHYIIWFDPSHEYIQIA